MTTETHIEAPTGLVIPPWRSRKGYEPHGLGYDFSKIPEIDLNDILRLIEKLWNEYRLQEEDEEYILKVFRETLERKDN